MKLLLTTALLFLSGCSQTDKLDGFKEIRFGLDNTSLKALGFDCPIDGECDTTTPSSSSTSPPKAKEFTLFGKAVQVKPKIKSGKVVSIDISTDMGREEIIALLKGEYGNPKSYDYDTFSGGRARTSYWLFDNGASISLTETISEGSFGIASMMQREGLDVRDYLKNHSTLYYRDRTETFELLKTAKVNTIDPNDT